MESKTLAKSIISGLSLLLGLCLLGLFVYKGLKTFSDKDRVVAVKGLAEMNMEATSANIDLSFSVSGDNLLDVIAQKDARKNAIVAYLNGLSYDKNDIKIKNNDIVDREKYYEIRWEDGRQIKEKIDRYTITQSISIRLKDVKSAEDVKSSIELDLIRKELTSNVVTNYVFPDLNSIKPRLIAESTKNARIAGEQFANDSKAKLGNIKTASQGQISIADQYYDEEAGEASKKPEEPYIQKARVVSTIVFFLE